MYCGLQRLRALFMPWQCHFLRKGLPFLFSLQTLCIDYYEEEQVETDNQDVECCCQGLNKLQLVRLSFGSMNCCFPKWVMRLPGLKELRLYDCGEMNIDGWVAQQTPLNGVESFHILSTEELLWIHDIPWNLLPSLTSLYLELPMNTVPRGIQQLVSLRYLTICNCRLIKEIPEWMMNLASLQELSLWKCSPELKARCEPENGADWHFISHIPSINID